jgi:hypothetical protein
MQEREKSSTDELPTKFTVEFFCPTSRSSQESEGFFFRRATYKGTYVEAVESTRAGLSPKKGDVRKNRKEKKKTKEGGLSPTRRGRENEEKKKTKEGKKVAPAKARFRVPSAKNFFFFKRVFGFGSSPSHLKYRLLRDLVYEEAMCEGSSGNGLPYAARAVP